jgi:lycopene cyclase domain-containing protein
MKENPTKDTRSGLGNFLRIMTYPKLLAIFCVISVILLGSISLIKKGHFWYFGLDKAELYAIFLFWLVWWIADAVAIKSGIWSYNKSKIWNIWVVGIPLEDHIAGICAPYFAIYALKLFL